MSTVPQVLIRIIEKRPFLHDALAKGIINYASLADSLKPEVETELRKEVANSAIIMALRRLSEKLEKSFKSKIKFDEETDINIKSGLFELALARNERTEKGIREIHASIHPKKRDLLAISEGIEQIVIVTNTRFKKSVTAKFRETDIITKMDNLAAVTVSISMNVFKQPGFFYLLTRALTWEDINIVEMVSTLTELTFIVKEEDVTSAYSAIKRIIKEHS